jgi:hypothetical protein
MTSVTEPTTFPGPSQALQHTDASSREDESEAKFREKDSEATTDCVVLFINEASLVTSPQLTIQALGKFNITAILDSGSEVNLLSERIYEELRKIELNIPVLPVENVLLVTAFGRGSKRIRRQALVEFKIGQDVFETIFMISSQLANNSILGCQFLREYGFRINFDSETITYARDGAIKEQTFAPKADSLETRSNDRGVIRKSSATNHPIAGQRPSEQTADCDTPSPIPLAADGCEGSPPLQILRGSEATKGAPSGPRTGTNPLNSERDKKSSDPGAVYARLINRLECVPIDGLTRTDESPSGDPAFPSATPDTELGVMSMTTALPSGVPIPRSKSQKPDPRSLLAADLSSLVERVTSLSASEQNELYQVILQYKDHLTTQPGKCNLFTYRFQVNADKPIVSHSKIGRAHV